jgi:hypothetical protein
MRIRTSILVPAVAAVLALAGALLVVRGATEALVMIAIVAGLTGMYLLRRYARAEVLYRRRAEPAQHAEAGTNHRQEGTS